MTIEEFNVTGFGPNMFAEYKGDRYPIAEVAFDEALLGLQGVYGSRRSTWVRCENVTIV